MALWMIRGGTNDVFFANACEYGLAILGFDPTPDLAGVSNKSELHDLIAASYPERSKGTVTKWTTEIGSFLWSIEPGDAVIMPYSSGTRFRLGIVSQGPYRYRADLPIQGKHTRPVVWNGDIGRDELPNGLWEQLQGQVTVQSIDGSVDVTIRSDTSVPSAIDEVLEGERRLVEQKILSRNRAVANEVWENNLRANNNVGRCEACEFEHAERQMFDVHHLNPIAIGGARRTRVSDLALLCPRCHRWAHMKAGYVPFTIAEIRLQIARR